MIQPHFGNRILLVQLSRFIFKHDSDLITILQTHEGYRSPGLAVFIQALKYDIRWRMIHRDFKLIFLGIRGAYIGNGIVSLFLQIHNTGAMRDLLRILDHFRDGEAFRHDILVKLSRHPVNDGKRQHLCLTVIRPGHDHIRSRFIDLLRELTPGFSVLIQFQVCIAVGQKLDRLRDHHSVRYGRKDHASVHVIQELPGEAVVDRTPGGRRTLRRRGTRIRILIDRISGDNIHRTGIIHVGIIGIITFIIAVRIVVCQICSVGCTITGLSDAILRFCMHSHPGKHGSQQYEHCNDDCFLHQNLLSIIKHSLRLGSGRGSGHSGHPGRRRPHLHGTCGFSARPYPSVPSCRADIYNSAYIWSLTDNYRRLR